MYWTVLLRKNGRMSNVRHIFVARAASSVRFAPEEALTFNDVPAGNLRAALIVRTRYSLEGFTKAVPRELWIEASSEMPSFDQAIVDLTNASAMVLPALAFCANAPIEEPEPEMAYELRVAENEHKLYQRQVSQEFGFPRARRRAPTAAITPFMQNWLAHPDAERIYRALVQYALALRHGAAGREVLAHAHFYMAVEALTKALLRDERRRTGKSEDELVVEWGIEKKNWTARFASDGSSAGTGMHTGMPRRPATVSNTDSRTMWTSARRPRLSPEKPRPGCAAPSSS
jgi:hypothetical protein